MDVTLVKNDQLLTDLYLPRMEKFKLSAFLWTRRGLNLLPLGTFAKAFTIEQSSLPSPKTYFVVVVV
jgi:hypothetical protein